MKLHLFEQVVLVPRNREEVFSFFSDPRNLELLTPSFLRFRFTREPPVRVKVGSLLDYRLRLYGVPLSWQSRIEVLEPPRRFVDLQTRGPYALWRHTHTFEETAPSATLMTDRVEYAIPFGPLGEIARVLLVERSLREIFDFREKKLRELFGAAPERQ